MGSVNYFLFKLRFYLPGREAKYESILIEVGMWYIPPEVLQVISPFSLKRGDSVQKYDYSLWMGKKANAPADW